MADELLYGVKVILHYPEANCQNLSRFVTKHLEFRRAAGGSHSATPPGVVAGMDFQILKEFGNQPEALADRCKIACKHLSMNMAKGQGICKH
ncbi:MAG: hypothetical protein J5654_12995 [Victivallales bacterium]|nr:hypothetical protein [Victivallales bacterium]